MAFVATVCGICGILGYIGEGCGDPRLFSKIPICCGMAVVGVDVVEPELWFCWFVVVDVGVLTYVLFELLLHIWLNCCCNCCWGVNGFCAVSVSFVGPEIIFLLIF